MNSTTMPVPRRRSRRRIVVALLLLLAALITIVVVQQSLTTASASVAHADPSTSRSTEVSGQPAPPPGDDNGSVIAPSDADGVIRDGDQPTVFDVDRVAVGRLDPALLDAVQRAATDAAQDGVGFRVNSGWRSAALQERMLRDAVDLGPLTAQDWLAQHGAGYGLCQIYANEPWHYELRPDAVTQGCPQMYADPTEDPRMQP